MGWVRFVGVDAQMANLGGGTQGRATWEWPSAGLARPVDTCLVTLTPQNTNIPSEDLFALP